MNEQVEQKDAQIQRTFFDCQMRGRLGEQLKKVKELRSTHQQLQKIHGDVKYSMGNIVNSIIITKYGATWKYQEQHFVKHMII